MSSKRQIRRSKYNRRNPAAAFRLAQLSRIAPTDLVRDKNDELGMFVLALSLAFNDLKGMVVFEQFLLKAGRPREGDASAAAGEWRGLAVHVHRWLGGVLHEIMYMVEKHQHVVLGTAFQELIAQLSPLAVACWKDLIAIALKQTDDGSDRQSLLARIRNTVGFHYYGLKGLHQGFERHFGDPVKTPINSDALYSPGASMEETRFHFADAAAQGAMFAMSAATKLGRPDDEVIQLAASVNEAIAPLIVAFLRERGGATV